MCVTPFLITGVGVDDAFILLQSFHQHRDIKCPEKRLSSVMVRCCKCFVWTSLIQNNLNLGPHWPLNNNNLIDQYSGIWNRVSFKILDYYLQ